MNKQFIQGVLFDWDHFQANGLYFLDEPEAALSPQRQLTLFRQIAGGFVKSTRTV